VKLDAHTEKTSLNNEVLNQYQTHLVIQGEM